MARRQRYRLRMESLEARRLLAIDGPRITEFVAANRASLLDEDGEYSDWIELHNPGSDPVSLDGWALTDDPEQPRRWVIPNLILPAGGYQVVFASGKDRRDVNQSLHTNFRLDADGESLLLSRPDGQIEQQFGPGYPPQQEDVGYGLPLEQTALITPTTPGVYRVPGPQDVALADAWTSNGFDASDWETAIGGIGYDRRIGFANFGFEQADLSDWDSSGETRTGTAQVGTPPPQGTQQALMEATEFATARFSLETFLGLNRSDLNYAPGVQATVGSGLKRTVEVEAGSELQFDWNFLTTEPEVGASQDFAFLSISPGNVVVPLAEVREATTASATTFARETGYRTASYTFPEAGEYTIGVGVVNVTNRFRPSALLVDNFLINGVGSLEDTFQGRIDTDLESSLADVASSLWVRYEMDVPAETLAAGNWQSLQLAVRYDDAYAVYWNGAELARSNVPPDASWNSLALSDRPDEAADEAELITIAVDLVVPGRNTLAIQVFKSADDDANVFLQVGLTALGAYAETPVFLRSATPGRPNISEAFRVAEPVQFSVPHGFYDQPFDLQLTTPTVGAVIHYTLDGSEPTAASPRYESPLAVRGTETVRAVALRNDLDPSEVVTQSYLFVRDVLTQSRSSALARGFPSSWGFLPSDYAMDPRIAGQNGTDSFDGRYADTMRDDLLSLPTISIVMDQQDLFGDTGIYSNPEGRGIDWERPTSVELIYPDGRQGFHVNAGIRLQGGISRFVSSKHSLRLLFKDIYGPAKLEFPFFGPDGANTFDSISLRAGSGEHLVGIHYIRDEFSRRLQLASGNLAARGNYMHLYINGVYWGMYNPAERVDGQYAANYLGGDKDDYDVLNGGDLGNEGVSVVTGSLDAWSQTVNLASQVESARTQADKTAAYLRLKGMLPDGTRDPAGEVYLDTENYIDYLITQVYVRNSDWPIRNYYMLRRRGPDSTGFQFFVWDNEFTLDRGQREALSSITRDGPGVLYQMLDTSEAFRVEFMDRVQQQFRPGGPFYVNPDNRTFDPERPEDNRPAALYAELIAEVFSPLAPETARWGDEIARNGRLLVRDGEWAQTANSNLTDFFPIRSRDFLDMLRRDGFYRDAPTFTPPGGLVVPGQTVTLGSATAGAIYYTLDGTDPRLPDGTLDPAALRYQNPIVITERTQISARVLNGDQWSAADDYLFVTDALPADVDTLRFSELNYNPHASLPQFGEADVDNDEFEFIELANVSDRAVDLRDVRLVRADGEGVEFTFGQQILAAGARIVIPQNRAAFVSRFGDTVPLAVGAGSENPADWTYDGRLGNGGETLTLTTALGEVIERMTYDDADPWPSRGDGAGSSLERIDLTADPDDPKQWAASRRFGGSPGDVVGNVAGDVVINELLSRPAPGGQDQIELQNIANTSVDLSGWYLSDSPDDYLRYRFPVGSVLASGGYLTVQQSSLLFGLDGDLGEQLYLIAADSRGKPSRFADVVRFDASDIGVSLGRWPDGSGELFPQAQTSFGTANAGPRLGGVVVTEVHYHPEDPDGGGVLTGDVLEFVEVMNRSDSSLDLSRWSLDGSARFTFPDDTSLEPGANLVVVNFDPIANPSRAVTFRLALDVVGSVTLVGPWVGNLVDTEGTVALYKPAPGDAGQTQIGRVLVDRVDYRSESPWPTELAGSGRSLNRNRSEAFGNLPASWTGATATPGRVAFDLGVPGDVNGDGRLDVQDADLLCGAIHGLDSQTRFDLNRDGRVDRADLDYLVGDLLGSGPGDADLDGTFDSRDLVRIFIASEYDDGIDGNSTWSEGDWNCDGEFDSRDIVLAFIRGGYSPAARRAMFDANLTLLAAARVHESQPRLRNTDQDRLSR